MSRKRRDNTTADWALPVFNVSPEFDGVSWRLTGGRFNIGPLTERECARACSELGWTTWETELVMDFKAAEEFLAAYPEGIIA